MKKVLLCTFGMVWMIAGIISLGYVGAAEWGAPVLRSFICAFLWSIVSIASLFAMDWLSRW